MILNHCTTCTVYGVDGVDQRKIPVRSTGDQIMLLLRREKELSDSSDVRIDFFDGQIGCVKTNCELLVRKNYDPSVSVPWVADCEIQEVIEITEARRSIRMTMEKEVTFASAGKDDFRGVIQNISEGGIYFITRTRLKRDDTVRFSYSFIERDFQMEAVILREEDLRDGRYGYGCQFLALAAEAQKDIRQYVYLRRQGMVW